jgi:hypothetical protein
MNTRYPAILLGAALLASATATAAQEAEQPDALPPGVTPEEQAQRRSLNEEQLEHVYRFYGDYTEAERQHREAVEAYERAVEEQQRESERIAAEHEAEMERWRDAVRRCESGDYSYCQPQE